MTDGYEPLLGLMILINIEETMPGLLSLKQTRAPAGGSAAGTLT